MKTIKTKYGLMNLYETKDELDNFTYRECIAWLEFNDSNGCYSVEDQNAEFKELLSLDEMKALVLEQCEY